ncbi:MAG: VOC family protein [Steroidobacteraceae bacterium]
MRADREYFSVTDLEGTLRSARDAGAVILRPIETQPWGERSFYCTDPLATSSVSSRPTHCLPPVC